MPNGGCLGLGCCPGYRLTPLAVIRQPGSLSEDLALIAAWKPRFMLSLMEEDDLASVGAPIKVLADDLAALGVEWLYLPIPNLRPPDEKFERAWVDLWPRFDKEFQQGGRVFIHCYAGLGRTGTVALADPDALWHERARRHPDRAGCASRLDRDGGAGALFVSSETNLEGVTFPKRTPRWQN